MPQSKKRLSQPASPARPRFPANSNRVVAPVQTFPAAIVLHVAGSVPSNPGPGAWAYVLTRRTGGDVSIVERSGALASTTNQRVVLQATIEGLGSLGDDPTTVEVRSNSKYLTDNIDRVAYWHSNGWRKSSGGEVSNRDLWEEIYDLNNRHRVSWVGTSGRAQEAGAERAHQLAIVEATNAVAGEILMDVVLHVTIKKGGRQWSSHAANQLRIKVKKMVADAGLEWNARSFYTGKMSRRDLDSLLTRLERAEPTDGSARIAIQAR